MKVSVSGVDAAIQGLEAAMLQAAQRGAAQVRSVAADAVRIGVRTTPRYSGTAWRAWVVDTQPIHATINSGMGVDHLEYPEGLKSSEVEAEADHYWGVALSRTAKFSDEWLTKLASGQVSDFVLYVGNEASYAGWLRDGGYGGLRDVNADFYTMQEVMSETLRNVGAY